MKKLPAFLRVPLLLLLTGLLTQCQRPEEAQPPQPLLPKEKMVRLLVELHLTESRVEGAALPPDSARALYLRLHNDILWRHDVSDSLFVHSYRYYAAHEKDLDEIYGTVIDSLAFRQLRLTNPAAAAAEKEIPKW
ncbi:protein of unknown function [Hymenobacter daecheongensis DSM 21074]|uniref:DUF4296 domain-containing protein n=1 Tax=Hymenobacter daecheongensis DSM 21074 TaxID=1121955 RepID=A0A1M6F4N6_9BACT|nr:DUF4296 domain-containing protein [Hymenobacter daecheongensis]SHI92688.1 protein of unknown function [Hymenobacter daecheongensis DSM 21074]